MIFNNYLYVCIGVSKYLVCTYPVAYCAFLFLQILVIIMTSIILTPHLSSQYKARTGLH